ncbi:MAG: hypothetical protein U0519_04515 [Candidatus Gracilibacteria bacterium]
MKSPHQEPVVTVRQVPSTLTESLFLAVSPSGAGMVIVLIPGFFNGLYAACFLNDSAKHGFETMMVPLLCNGSKSGQDAKHIFKFVEIFSQAAGYGGTTYVAFQL